MSLWLLRLMILATDWRVTVSCQHPTFFAKRCILLMVGVSSSAFLGPLKLIFKHLLMQMFYLLLVCYSTVCMSLLHSVIYRFWRLILLSLLPLKLVIPSSWVCVSLVTKPGCWWVFIVLGPPVSSCVCIFKLPAVILCLYSCVMHFILCYYSLLVRQVSIYHNCTKLSKSKNK